MPFALWRHDYNNTRPHSALVGLTRAVRLSNTMAPLTARFTRSNNEDTLQPDSPYERGIGGAIAVPDLRWKIAADCPKAIDRQLGTDPCGIVYPDLLERYRSEKAAEEV
jgi:hypothetical protein